MPRMVTHCEVPLPPPKLMEGSAESTSFISLAVLSSSALKLTFSVEEAAFSMA